MLNYFGAAGAVFLKAAGFRAVIAFGFGECCSAPSVCCGASFSSSLLFGFSFSFSVSLGAPNLFPLLGCVPFFLSFLYARFFFPFHHLHSLSLSHSHSFGRSFLWPPSLDCVRRRRRLVNDRFLFFMFRNIILSLLRRPSVCAAGGSGRSTSNAI